MSIEKELSLRTSYTQKIDYLGKVMESVYEAVVGLRTTYIDLAKKVYGGFKMICTECKHLHELNKEVFECEQCKSKRLAYAFGEATPIEEIKSES